MRRWSSYSTIARRLNRLWGEPLIWNPNPDNNDKVILLKRAADLRIKELWPDHLKWMVDAVVRLRKVFGPRIKALQIGPINGGQSPPEKFRL